MTDKPMAGTVDVAATQRRTVRTLVVSQAVGAVGVTLGVAMMSLLARDVSGSESLAGLAQTAQVVGTALWAWALARLAGRYGRRVSLASGYALGVGGCALAVVAGAVASFPLLLLAGVLVGSVTAVNNASRYAATDLAPSESRARALSMVVWATTLGAVAGPNLTGVGTALADRTGLPELTGPFVVGGAVVAVAMAWVVVRLRPDPLLLASELALTEDDVEEHAYGVGVVATLRAFPAIGAAVLALAGAHAAMVSVMIMTPLHMDHGGAHLQVIGFVISVHVLGMFAFSPLVGAIADRLGRAATLGIGGILLLVALFVCANAPTGSSWQLFVALFLLGLGWSFATVAGSAVIADQTPLASRVQVQGFSDMSMSLMAAAGGAVAGVVVARWGYAELAAMAAVLALLVVAAAVVVRRDSMARTLDPNPTR